MLHLHRIRWVFHYVDTNLLIAAYVRTKYAYIGLIPHLHLVSHVLSSDVE